MAKEKRCEESGLPIGSEKEKSYQKELDSIRKVERKSKKPKLDKFTDFLRDQLRKPFISNDLDEKKEEDLHIPDDSKRPDIEQE